MYSVTTPDLVVVITVTPVVTGVSVHLFSSQEVTVMTVVDCSSTVDVEVDRTVLFEYGVDVVELL